MKKYLLFLSFAVLILFGGCSGNVDNRLMFKNMAAGTLFVNFRATIYTVNPGEHVTLPDLPGGIYTYATTFELPPGTTAGTASGAVSGEVEIKAGTKILVFFSSTIEDGAYNLFATISSSDELEEEPTGP